MTSTGSDLNDYVPGAGDRAQRQKLARKDYVGIAKLIRGLYLGGPRTIQLVR